MSAVPSMASRSVTSSSATSPCDRRPPPRSNERWRATGGALARFLPTGTQEGARRGRAQPARERLRRATPPGAAPRTIASVCLREKPARPSGCVQSMQCQARVRARTTLREEQLRPTHGVAVVGGTSPAVHRRRTVPPAAAAVGSQAGRSPADPLEPGPGQPRRPPSSVNVVCHRHEGGSDYPWTPPSLRSRPETLHGGGMMVADVDQRQPLPLLAAERGPLHRQRRARPGCGTCRPCAGRPLVGRRRWRGR